MASSETRPLKEIEPKIIRYAAIVTLPFLLVLAFQIIIFYMEDVEAKQIFSAISIFADIAAISLYLIGFVFWIEKRTINKRKIEELFKSELDEVKTQQQHGFNEVISIIKNRGLFSGDIARPKSMLTEFGAKDVITWLDLASNSDISDVVDDRIIFITAAYLLAQVLVGKEKTRRERTRCTLILENARLKNEEAIQLWKEGIGLVYRSLETETTIEALEKKTRKAIDELISRRRGILEREQIVIEIIDGLTEKKKIPRLAPTLGLFGSSRGNHYAGLQQHSKTERYRGLKLAQEERKRSQKVYAESRLALKLPDNRIPTKYIIEDQLRENQVWDSLLQDFTFIDHFTHDFFETIKFSRRLELFDDQDNWLMETFSNSLLAALFPPLITGVDLDTVSRIVTELITRMIEKAKIAIERIPSI